jgi:serine/threonine protein kinase
MYAHAYPQHSKSGHYTEEATIKTVKQMVSAVAYLHERDIVHRDLKLENWVYRDSGAQDSLVLIDFGLSKKYHQRSLATKPARRRSHGSNSSTSHTNGGGVDGDRGSGEDAGEGSDEYEENDAGQASEDEPIEFHDVVGSSYYIAPEVLEGAYGMECDMWSLGVIVFMLLSGRPPFGGEDETEIMKRALLGVYSMNHHVWDNVSDEAKDFVRKLLQKDPAKRMTSAQALKHPWLELRGRDHVKMDPSIIRNLRRFTRANEFKRLAMQAVVFSLGRDEVAGLEKAFEAMDEDNDGYVSLKEFRKAMAAHGVFSEEEQEKMFDAIDMDHIGKGIHLNEFLAAAVSQAQFGGELDLLHAFERLDIHNTGKIRVGDLREILGGSHTPEEISKMLGDFMRDARRAENRHTVPSTPTGTSAHGTGGRGGGGGTGSQTTTGAASSGPPPVLKLMIQSPSGRGLPAVDDATEVTYTEFLRAMRASVPQTPHQLLSPTRRSSSKRRSKRNAYDTGSDSAAAPSPGGGGGDTPPGASPRHNGAMLPPSIHVSVGGSGLGLDPPPPPPLPLPLPLPSTSTSRQRNSVEQDDGRGRSSTDTVAVAGQVGLHDSHNNGSSSNSRSSSSSSSSRPARVGRGSARSRKASETRRSSDAGADDGDKVAQEA